MANYDTYKSYVRQKKTHKNNELFSYKKWLKENGKAPISEYIAEKNSAKSDYLRATPDYGALAESLAERGLESSGYKQYVKDTARSNYSSRVQNAEKELLSELESNRHEYSDYVSDFKARQAELSTSVTKKLEEMDLSDKQSMLEYAMNAGLSPEYAEEAVKIAYDTGVSTKKSAVLKAITELAYGKDDAYDYAKRLGLPDDIATELSEYAGRLRAKNSSENNLNNLK